MLRLLKNDGPKWIWTLFHHRITDQVTSFCLWYGFIVDEIKELKKLLNQEPLYKKLENKYSQSLVPELEHKKQILKQIRERFKPMDMGMLLFISLWVIGELDMHEVSYKLMKRESLKEKQNWHHFKNSLNYSKEIHVSKHLSDVIEENMKFKEQFKYKEELAKLRRNKMNHYGIVVKEKHSPKIDPTKRRYYFLFT